MAVDDVYQITLVTVVNGREASNVFYYVETTASGFDPIETAANLNIQFWFEIWDDIWRFKVTSFVSLRGIWTRRIWPTEEVAELLPFSDEIGAIVFDAIPNGSCALISMTCDDPARNFNRRTYMSGLSEAWVVQSQIPADKITSLNVLGLALSSLELTIEFGGDPVFHPAAYSKKLAAASDPAPFRLISGFLCQKNIRSQRRRNLSGAI